jgi:hypothetical protein
MELTQAREEKENTLAGKTEQERDADRDKERLKKIARGVEKLAQAIRIKIEEAIHDLANRFQLQAP